MNKSNLNIIYNYLICEEVRSFEEEYNCEINLDNLASTIKVIEENEETNHILYNLLILKQELENEE